MLSKECYKCKQEKELSDFHKDKSRKDGYFSYCKKCYKLWYIDNKTKILERHISYRNKNRKKIKDYSKKHSVLYKDRKNQIRKERRINDINFRITDRLRSRIRLVLKNISKSDNTMNLLGCSIEQLKNHLQNTAI